MKRSSRARMWKSTAALLSLLLVLALSVGLYRSLPERWEGTVLPREEELSLSVVREEPFSLEAFLAAPPVYEGEAAKVLNGNVPLFTEEELRMAPGLQLSELDTLGRCGPALGCLGPETLPTEERGPIGEVRPSGWHTIRYDDRIEDRYLYNRCHLIGYQLCGENAEPRNLITGTRYLNMTGMLPYENAVLGYIIQSSNHVLYRARPVFEGENLLASGVLLEAPSLEDQGAGLQFFVYLFNAQPGVRIDYADGISEAEEDYLLPEPTLAALTETEEPGGGEERSLPAEEGEITYVFNNNTMRFHRPDCPSAVEMRPENRVDFTGTREEALALGYEPCGRCQP